MRNLRAFGWLLAACLVMAGACTNSGQQSSGAKSSATAQNMEPGIEFTRVSVGLPSHTMDYIGGSAVALAGAKAGNKVFFAVREDNQATIYSRDLNTGVRKTVVQIPDLLPGSLTCDAEGNKLVYNRGKRIDTYIDDPLVKDPVVIAVPYEYDIASGEESALFNFKDPDYLPYRTDRMGVFLSPDGHRVATLCYNRDELTLANQVGQWLNLYKDLQTGGSALAEWKLDDPVATLRLLLVAPSVKPRLEKMGVEPADKGDITPEEHSAMEQLQTDLSNVKAVLLLNEDGKSRLLELSFPEGYRTGYVYSILCTSNNHIVLYGSMVGEKQIKPHKVFDVDLQTGKCSLLSEFMGSASTIQINNNETQVMVVYNPVDLQNNRLLNQSNLLRIPLGGGNPIDTEMPDDFVAYVDITSDGAWMLGQQSGNNDLYLVDTAAAKRYLLCKMLGQVEGLYLADGAKSGVYLENGIMYHLDIPADPEASPDWNDGSQFKQYKQPIDDFISSVGFEIPDGLDYEWEERKGLGAHEISVGIFNPDKPGELALLRYSLDHNAVVSMWFPTTCPFTNPNEHTGAALDYYNCKDIATKILAEVGWLNPDTMQEYHPGPNPLFDKGTNSYIVIFRDGYWYGSGDDRKWIYNQDATVRIYADTGSIAEMTLSKMDEVQDQPISLSLDSAEYSLRNSSDYPIPQGSPIRYDLDNYRLVIGQRSIKAKGPAEYTSRLEDRICYEIDSFLQPEDILMMTGLVDTETGDVLGQVSYEQGGVEKYLQMTGSK